MRVLLADPDRVFLEIVQCYLWKRGHESQIACDGLECVSRLRKTVPDVVVLDENLMWGGRDGVLAWMEEEALLARLPVILTAGWNVADEVIAQSPLPTSCLIKPYRLGELLAQINAVGRLEMPREPLDATAPFRDDRIVELNRRSMAVNRQADP